MKEIAVIIPTYKAHETIERTLQSIAIQSLRDKIKVYISVDADGEDYDYLLGYQKFFELEILYSEKNGGPGLARQFAIDRSKEPYIVFIDADDTFVGAFALTYLYQMIISGEDVIMARCLFTEETANGMIQNHEHDMVWLHGKIYKRAFMDKYNIRFTSLRANEDVGFNRLFKLLKGENRIPSLNQIVYAWHYIPTSIVRNQGHNYEFSGSIEGAVTNTIESCEFAIHYDFAKEEVYSLILEQLFNNYIYYLRVLEYAPKQKEFALSHFRRFWRRLYHLIPEDFIKQYKKKAGFTTIYNSYIETQNFIPQISYFEFERLISK